MNKTVLLFLSVRNLRGALAQKIIDIHSRMAGPGNIHSKGGMNKTLKLLFILIMVGNTVAYPFTKTSMDGPDTPSTNSFVANKTTRTAAVERPLIQLNFEGVVQENDPVNTGSVIALFTQTTPFPTYTDNTPTPTGPAGSAIDFGTNPGNYVVESTGDISALKNLNAFTITGWINCKSSVTGPGGNRIVSWINNGGDGVDLVYRSDGRLQLGVNAWPDGSPAISSPGKIPADASAPAANWVFFAVTYQSSNGQVQFYFGRDADDASLDVTRTYNRGVVGSNIGKLAIGHFNDATRSVALNRMFKGLIDDIRVYGSALTPTDIGAVKQSAEPDTEPPTSPILTLVAKTYNSVSLSWSGATDNVGISQYVIYNGSEVKGYSSSTNATLIYLSPNTAYSFTVKAVDARQNTSQASNTVNVTTDETALSNTRLGHEALASNTTGTENTALGSHAMQLTTSGLFNTAVGFSSLKTNRTGYGNTAIGAAALGRNTASDNTAVGQRALNANTTGQRNTALGAYSLQANTTGEGNIGIGDNSLGENETASNNIAIGQASLLRNWKGEHNTAIGSVSLANNTTGNLNTAIGASAGPSFEGIENSFSNTTAIGAHATVTASDQIRLGNANVTSIGGQVSWSTLSDGRFKKDIKEDVSGLEFIDQLRPVSYTVDKDAVDKFLKIPDSVSRVSADARKKPTRQTGFVAQEVEAIVKKTGYVFHGVEAPQNENDHYGIRYAEFVVPLVKAMQELNATVKEQKKEIETLKQQLEAYTGSINDQTISNDKILLYQNNPNPFSSDTEINLSLPETITRATVIVYNLEGKELKSIPVQERGRTSVKIRGNELHAGMYLYALIVDGKVVDTKRMILTK